MGWREQGGGRGRREWATCLMREGLGSSRARVMHGSVLDCLSVKPSSLVCSPPHSSPLHSRKSPSFLILNVLPPFVSSSLFLYKVLASCLCLVLARSLGAACSTPSSPGNLNLERRAAHRSQRTRVAQRRRREKATQNGKLCDWWLSPFSSSFTAFLFIQEHRRAVL